MFASRIRELRKNNKMTQKALADKLFVDCSAVTKWETGKAKPDFDKQQKLADIFNVSIDYLLGRVDNNLELTSDIHESSFRVPVLGKIPAGIPIEAIEDILDYMGSTELAANLFRATQTDEKLRRENIRGKEAANKTHYEVGEKVRQTIAELGGTMPEDLPTPQKSIKQIESEQKKLMKKKD